MGHLFSPCRYFMGHLLSPSGIFRSYLFSPEGYFSNHLFSPGFGQGGGQTRFCAQNRSKPRRKMGGFNRKIGFFPSANMSSWRTKTSGLECLNFSPNCWEVRGIEASTTQKIMKARIGALQMFGVSQAANHLEAERSVVQI